MRVINRQGIDSQLCEDEQLKLFIFLSIALLSLGGCSSFNDAMTPSLDVTNDSFDNSLSLYQAPVSSSSSLSEDWHTLGFEWNEKTPNIVYLSVGVYGIKNISSVSFNVDGFMIEKLSRASSLTDYGDWSQRRFAVSLQDFIRIANADDVRMKVVRINEYTVSSFGKKNSGAIVNTKFKPFLDKLQSLKLPAN